MKLLLMFALLLSTLPLTAQINPAFIELNSALNPPAAQGREVRGVPAPERIPQPNTPCNAGAIVCNQTVTGRISADSCRTSDGTYGLGYYFSGTAGQQVTFDARSPEIRLSIGVFDPNDTLLFVAVADTVGVTISRTVTLSLTGTYTFILMAASPATFGDYTATLSCGSTDGGNCPAIGLSCGTQISAAINSGDCEDTAGYKMDSYTIRLSKDQSLVFTAEAGFPLWLNIQEPEDRAGVYVGGNQREVVRYTSPVDQEVTIVVSPWEKGHTGSYTLIAECANIAPCRMRGVRPAR